MSFFSRFFLLLGPSVAIACAAEPTEPTATSGQDMTSSWFAAHLPDGSADAQAVLALMNDTSRAAAFYVSECGLSESQAAVIVAYRSGDEPASTSDDKVFADLRQLDEVPFTDVGFWNASIACAKRVGGGTSTGGDAGTGPAVMDGGATCASAKDLGHLAGDRGAEVATATGACSTWMAVAVDETVTGLVSQGVNQRLRATLTSPPGHNFDLFLYSGQTNPLTVECTSVVGKSEVTTADDHVALTWGEGKTSPNGIDNSAVVTIEVRQIGGTCDPTAKWSLKLEGNK